MSNREDEVSQRAKVDRSWNALRFSAATRLPTALARSHALTRNALRSVARAANIKSK